MYPSIKEFSPRKHWEQTRNDTNLINAEFNYKFSDKFSDPNISHIVHQFANNTVQDVKWQTNLRNISKPLSRLNQTDITYRKKK